MNRRNFIKSSAIATSGLAIAGEMGCSQKIGESRSTGQFSSLKPVTDNIKPISNEERKGRIEKARRLMRENDLAAIFLESGSSMTYFTGVQWGRSERMFGAVIPASGELAYVCPAFEEERAREKILFGDDVRVWQEHESPYKLVAQTLKDRGIRTGNVGIEETVRFFLFDGIRKENGNLQLKTADPVSAGCRMIKSQAEIALMQKANDGVIAAYEAVFATMEKGMTQYDFNNNCASAFKAVGIQGGAGAQFGQYSAFPHGSSKPQELQEGDIVLVDGVGSVEGYRGDITRTTVFGEPTKMQRDRWNLERQAQDAAFAVIKPGVSCESVDAAARTVINDAGFGPEYENFFHRVGHGIGLDTHEWTYLVKGNKTKLQPGMCFSNEPGIYVYGEFGVRLEDCFHVTETGYQSFTKQSPAIDRPFG